MTASPPASRGPAATAARPRPDRRRAPAGRPGRPSRRPRSPRGDAGVQVLGPLLVACGSSRSGTASRTWLLPDRPAVPPAAAARGRDRRVPRRRRPGPSCSAACGLSTRVAMIGLALAVRPRLVVRHLHEPGPVDRALVLPLRRRPPDHPDPGAVAAGRALVRVRLPQPGADLPDPRAVPDHHQHAVRPAVGGQAHHDLFTLHGAGRWTRLCKLQLPSALPSIFTGLRIAAGLAVIGAIVADFFFRQGDPGIGILIDRYRPRLQSEQMFGAVILSSLLGIVVFWFFGFLAHGSWGLARVRGRARHIRSD